MAGYKKPCRYCDNLVPPESKVCPFCARSNPIGALRCLQCRNPVEEGWKVCSHCGQALEVECPFCKERTFLSEVCGHCGKKLIAVCPNKKCNSEQPLIGERCARCNTKLI